MSGWKETEIGRIPDSWNMENFGSLLKEGVRNGIYKSKEFHGYGSRIVNMGELFEYPRIGNQKMKKVFLTETEKKKSLLKKGDLLFARRSLTIEGAGKCVIVEESDGNLSFESSIIRARPNSNIANSDYLFYLFNSRIGKYLLGSILRVVAVAGITGSDLMDLEVPLPPVEEQKEIAKTLSNLDNKITLLRQQNQTLEELAQTLFKRWFVEFEFPDENGRPYKSSGGKMVESELGEIPEGWRVGQYGDIVNISSGKGLKKDDFIKNGSFEVLGANGRLGFSDEYLINEEAIITGRVGTLGTVFLVREPVWLSDNVLISQPREKCLLYFAYFILRRFNFNSLNRGSTQPLITQGDLKLVDILVPDISYLNNFHDVSEKLFIKIFSNEKEIQTLTQLRDTLLPKLMSGEVRVKSV